LAPACVDGAPLGVCHRVAPFAHALLCDALELCPALGRHVFEQAALLICQALGGLALALRFVEPLAHPFELLAGRGFGVALSLAAAALALVALTSCGLAPLIAGVGWAFFDARTARAGRTGGLVSLALLLRRVACGAFAGVVFVGLLVGGGAIALNALLGALARAIARLIARALTCLRAVAWAVGFAGLLAAAARGALIVGLAGPTLAARFALLRVGLFAGLGLACALAVGLLALFAGLLLPAALLTRLLVALLTLLIGPLGLLGRRLLARLLPTGGVVGVALLGGLALLAAALLLL
jgi:hypothetical protein